jgi:D-alanyl-D-alanine dipeptidase
MKVKFLILTVLMPLMTNTIQWESSLEKHRSIMGESTYQLLLRQYQAFDAKHAPAIADSCIKEIPIQECGEELIDVHSANHARIKVMSEEELPLAHEYLEDIDPRSEKHSLVRKRVFDCLSHMIQELDEIAPDFGYAKGDLEIRLFEGLRDLATQKKLFDTKLTELLQASPIITHDQAYKETCKWVSPYTDNVPVHSTGAAIDIALWSKKLQNFCDMGRFNVGGTLAPTFSQDSQLSAQQANNRLLFLVAAARAGLVNYLYEFWHFSLGDKYAAYWLESNVTSRLAFYGSV